MNLKFFIFLIIIFTVALLPREVVNFYKNLGVKDSAVHIGAFAGISIFCLWNYYPSIGKALIAVILICILTESLQGLLTKTRGFSWDDIMKNTIGIAIIFLPFTAFRVVFRGKRKETKG